ncbi:MAG: hypothetical protein K2O40_11690 [Lachnospiraceae bacterium]|nr:hypothetical protein [Lachnospiraceae bacterium]
MRKKCIAIAKKAMVWALAASMLVATPLTASAAGLRGVYSVSDGTNNDITGTGDSTHTGTVTTTDSNTTVLGDNDAKIIGIVLDKNQVNAVKGVPTTLKATVVLDNVVDNAVVEALNSKIKWEVQEFDGKVHSDTNKKLSVTVKATDRTVATLNPRQGTVIGEDMKVVAKIDGRQTITFTNSDGELVTKEFEGLAEAYTATADVFIKEYTDSIELDQNIGTKYVKHTFDMNDYIVKRVPASANDSITWSISSTVKNAATISASGVVTVKTYKAGNDNKVTVTAVTEKGKKATADFVIDPGKKAELVTINEVKDGDLTGDLARGIKTRPMDMGGTDPDSDGVQFHATMWRKINSTLTKDTDISDDSEQITDDITWTSNKPAIVEVVGSGKGQDVILRPLKVGTATITAKATNGKSAKLTVKVSATLNKLTLEDDGASLWSGQSLSMTVIRDPEQNTDALKWTIEKVNNGTKDIANPNASINSKGVLTIKNVINPAYKEVKVTVTSKKDSSKTATATITVDQSSINGITVTEINGNSKVDLARVNATDSRDKITGRTSNLSVPKGKTYTATVDAGSTGGAESLKWTTSSAKVVKLENNGDGTAKITALAKGTATITVSGVYVSSKNDDGSAKKAKAIKTTFKVSVKQPATSLTINKSEVVLKDTQKLQNVTFTVKQNKNAKDAVTWSVVQTKGSTEGRNVNFANTAKGKLTLAKEGYEAGDEFVVTAKAASGVTATATVKVVTASTAVLIRDPEKDSENWGNDYYTYTQVKKNGSKGAIKKNATVLGLGESLELYPVVNVGTKQAYSWTPAGGTDNSGRVAAEVTYSVNKQGIVQIIDDTVYRVKEGSVVLTVKTKDGKSYKLTIDDVSKEYKENADN